MEQMWNHGGKKWTYEYKYRRGGKTLCALYAKEQTIGFMVILGKDERTKFESMREMFSNAAQKREVKAALSNTFGFGGHNACAIVKKFVK
jgi:hypothetical protein